MDRLKKSHQLISGRSFMNHKREENNGCRTGIWVIKTANDFPMQLNDFISTVALCQTCLIKI